ncbi:hypothetical protein ABZ682_19025 [Streptomyces griseoviridis]|uniref:hypothetical protein n=1 Tax=Streptomyces griseoviridis TaxID=45398 RepID=UPI0033D5B166
MRGIIPLLADKLDAISDPGDRSASLNLLRGAIIVISDTPDAEWDGEPLARESGRLRTTYYGGVPGVTVDFVLDLADQLRTQLA